MAAKKKHKKNSDVNLPIIMDYGIGCISVYDPVDMLPYSELPITEQTRFKKLGKEMKAEFKWLAASITIEFWEENRQIPFGEEMSKLRTRLGENVRGRISHTVKRGRRTEKLYAGTCHQHHKQTTQIRKGKTKTIKKDKSP